MDSLDWYEMALDTARGLFYVDHTWGLWLFSGRKARYRKIARSMEKVFE